MSAYGNWANAGPTATVRDAERFVQIEMAHVGAKVPGLGDANERVEVGAVDIDLATVGVHRCANRSD